MATYTVKSGDSLLSLSKQFNIPLTQLQRVNGLVRATPGQTIKLPKPPKPPGGGIAMPPVGPSPVEPPTFWPQVDPFAKPNVTYGFTNTTQPSTQPAYPMSASPRGYGVVPVSPPGPDSTSGYWRGTNRSDAPYNPYSANNPSPYATPPAYGANDIYTYSERNASRGIGVDVNGEKAYTYLSPNEVANGARQQGISAAEQEQELIAAGYVKNTNGGYTLSSNPSAPAVGGEAASTKIMWRDTERAQQWLQNAARRRARNAGNPQQPIQQDVQGGQGQDGQSQQYTQTLPWNIK